MWRWILKPIYQSKALSQSCSISINQPTYQSITQSTTSINNMLSKERKKERREKKKTFSDRPSFNHIIKSHHHGTSSSIPID
jgi:hypothetical protein